MIDKDKEIRRLTMANKQLTKMCDQYLAELAAERQRARLPDELVKRLRFSRALSIKAMSDAIDAVLTAVEIPND